MAIRLKLKIVRDNNELTIRALVSSGYETVKPEILLPSEITEKLNLLPSGSEVKEYALADGSLAKLIRI